MIGNTTDTCASSGNVRCNSCAIFAVLMVILLVFASDPAKISRAAFWYAARLLRSSCWPPASSCTTISGLRVSTRLPSSNTATNARMTTFNTRRGQGREVRRAGGLSVISGRNSRVTLGDLTGSGRGALCALYEKNGLLPNPARGRRTRRPVYSPPVFFFLNHIFIFLGRF